MSTATQPSRLGLAAILGVTAQLAAVIASLWSTPKLLHGLGEAAYGALAIVAAFTAYFFYLELGLGGAYIRELSGAIAKNEQEKAQRLFETAHALYLRVGALGAVLMLIVGVPYMSRATSDSAIFYQALGCLLTTAIMLFVSMALSASRGIIFAIQRADIFNRMSLFFQPTIPLVQVIAVWAGLGILGVLGVQMAGNLAGDLIMRRYSLRLRPEIIHRAKLHKEIWLELRGFSLYRFTSQLAQQGQWTGDRVLLGALLPTERISVYAISASIAQRLRIFALALNGPFFAAASERFAVEGVAGLAEICASFWRRVAVFLALASAGACFLAEPFLTSWVGAQYAGEGAPILQVMVFSTSILAISGLLGLSTDAAGVPRASAISALLGFVISVVSGVLCVPWFGPIGAAIGFTLGACVQLAFSAFSLGLLLGGREMLRMLCRCLLAPMLIGALSYGVMTLLPAQDGLLASLPASIIGALIGALSAVLFGVIQRQDLPARLQRLWVFSKQ